MRPTRLAALRTAIFLAIGFIALRVVYRIVFGGVDGGGVLLLDLPRIRLVGPFEHITLLGPVTSGGVASVVWGAVPFAVLVLAVGLLAVIVDLRALVARGAVVGPVRTISRALVVAWATLPALVTAVRRVRVARELRGERGMASLLVPVFEQTVERAIGLGASMEVRGFAATRRVAPTCEHPARLQDVALGYDGRWSIGSIDLDLLPGTLTIVTGATGAGKSTLLASLSGLFQHSLGGDQRGVIEVAGVDRRDVPPRETAGFVGVVAQAVRASFVAATVTEEIGFALSNRGVAPVIVGARVDEIADRLGIRHLLDREVGALSAGEACLVAIAAAIVEHPVLLLVDEPLADLDDSARARVVGVLDRLAHEAGICVVVAEHAIPEWGMRPDLWVEIRNGALQALSDAPHGQRHPHRAPAALGDDTPTIARIRALSVSHGDRVAVTDACLGLRAGEIVALRGPNGAGKSSLLHAIARPPRRGHVDIGGRDVHDLHRRRRRGAVALVPEIVDDLLFSTTVAEECRRSDRRAPAAGTADLFLQLIGATPDSRRRILDGHPRDLSAGERLCLVLAIQLSARPRVLLIDEPSRGLDATAGALVADALAEAAARGTAVLMATHDRAFAARCAHRTITMAAGILDPAEVTA